MADPAIVAAILDDLVPPVGRWREPVLIGVFGLPGTGKTEIAGYLAQRFPLVTLSTDALRLCYGLALGPATRVVMEAVVAALLPLRVAVLFDGIRLGRRDRLRVRQVADQHGAASAVLYTNARPEVIAARLAARQRDPARTAAEGKFLITREHFARIASYLDEPAADEQVWRLDTCDDAFDGQVTALERWLTALLADGAVP